MAKRKFPVGFIVPAQPVERDRPPTGREWVHEIKHDGYRMIVRRGGTVVRLWTRDAADYTDRLSTIAAAASRLKATSFTIDGEAVVIARPAPPSPQPVPAKRFRGRAEVCRR
jgi:ATP-dependent DNA ligase